MSVISAVARAVQRFKDQLETEDRLAGWQRTAQVMELLELVQNHPPAFVLYVTLRAARRDPAKMLPVLLHGTPSSLHALIRRAVAGDDDATVELLRWAARGGRALH